MIKHGRGLTIFGISLLIVMILILSTSPALLFSPMVTFIDTELRRSSGHETAVRTRMDFGSKEHMAAFPSKLGKWEGYDYDTTRYAELLGADIMLLRSYEPSTFTQPVFFLILQGKTESSFHSPKVCVRSQGYEIQEEGEEQVVITDAAWSKESGTAVIPLKKLVAVKISEDGKITERRVLLYCYVKGNRFYNDTITMLQMEALAPIEGSYEGALNEEKEFLSQAIPFMFEPEKETQWDPLFTVLVGWGLFGYLIIVFMCIVPIGIILYAKIR